LRINVKLFGIFRQNLPSNTEKPSFWLEMKTGAKIEDVFALLGIPSDYPSVIVCNHRIAMKKDVLKNGAVVAIFPPVDGG
jgi:molybdopterin converting factor small subunit